MRTMGKWLLAFFVLTFVALGFAACGNGGPEATVPATAPSAGNGGEEIKSIRGTVTQVNESSAEDMTDSIVVKVGDQELTFLLGGEVDQRVWNPPHLNGHRTFRSAIGIDFRQENGSLVVVRLTE